MTEKIRRAHAIDIMLCDDEQCGLVHVVLCDAKNNVFAEAVFEPTCEWQTDFMQVLLEVCRIARERQKTAAPPLIH